MGTGALLRLRNAYFSGSWDALWEQILRPEASHEVRAKVQELERHYEQQALMTRALMTRAQSESGLEFEWSEEVDLCGQAMEDAA